MIHRLKTWPDEFMAIVSGDNTFEYRLNDRGFKCGDCLILEEYDPKTDEYTGMQVTREITYILGNLKFGLPEGYVVMAVKPV